MRLTEEQLAAHQKRVKPPRTPLTTEIEGLQKAYASAKPKNAPTLRQLRESIQDIEKVFQGMKGKPKNAPTIAQKRRGSVGERIPTEHEEQAAVIKWWEVYAAQHKIPENLLFAIPNGANKSMAMAAKFKREGLRKGAPDLFLAIGKKGTYGLFIELKRTKGAQPSIEQRAFCNLLITQGYLTYICYGAEIAIQMIKEYLE